jgi:exopolyphosphatase/guanosine-5'-triphosphate,3'-diphosphate pyrophosphatase
MKVAAIDIGTNSIHLLIGEIAPDGRITVIERAREQVELGAGEFGAAERSGAPSAPHRITPEAFQRGVDALRRMRLALDGVGVEDIHATATSAVREAENGQAFCSAVKAATGIHVRVISGLDEARLVYLGTRSDIDFSRGRALVFDLGGGSTEFVLCDPEQALVTESVPLGHIRLAERFVRTDPIAESDRRDLKSHVAQLLQPLSSRVRPADFATLYGCSGTVRALARAATVRRGAEMPRHASGLLLHKSEIDDMLRIMRSKPGAQWDLPGIEDRRKRTLLAGATLIREIFRATGKEVLVTTERSLRDGLIADWILRHRPELKLSASVPDPRRRSVIGAMEHYGADMVHARRVADTALRLFDATAPIHRRSVDDRRLLEFSALLHDIGHFISGDDHHRHTQYLVRNTKMSGFTSPEVEIMAAVGRYHRGSRPKATHEEFKAFTNAEKEIVRLLSALVRVADALDRGHDGNVVRLDIELGTGLNLRAYTRDTGDLEHWSAVQRADWLAEVLGRPVSVTVERAALP